MSVSVWNTDPRMLWKLREIFGVGTIRIRHRLRKRTSFEWNAHTRQATRILEAIRPFLVIKGEQADLALAIMATITSGGHPVDPATIKHRSELAARLKVLKQRDWDVREVV